jgi:hypothetical protein
MNYPKIETITSNFRIIRITHNKSIIFHRSKTQYFKLFTKVRSGTDQIITPISAINKIQFCYKKDYLIQIMTVVVPKDVAIIINNYVQDCCDICNKYNSDYTVNIGQARLYLCQSCLIQNVLRLSNI